MILSKVPLLNIEQLIYIWSYLKHFESLNCILYMGYRTLLYECLLYKSYVQFLKVPDAYW